MVMNWYIEWAVPLGLGIIFSIVWFYTLKRKRLIENLPTAKIAGLVYGLTELKGRARKYMVTLRSPIAKKECFYYTYSVREEQKKTRTVRDSKGNTRTETYYEWVTLESGAEATQFYLEDETGRAIIDPSNADRLDSNEIYREILTSGPLYEWSYSRHPGQGRKREFVEKAIVEGDKLYIMGTAEQGDGGAWVIRRTDRDKELTISVKSEEQLKKGYAWTSIGIWILMMAGLFFGFLALFNRAFAPEGIDWSGDVHPRDAFALRYPFSIVLAAICALAYYTLTATIMMFNDLVFVKQRLRQAMSNVSVELKKRFDLIPNLVECCKAYVSHEKSVLEDIAALRYSFENPNAKDAGRILDEQTVKINKLLMIMEKYPDLKANNVLQNLMKTLADVENRIAHLRTYYNEHVKVYNNRRMQIPEVVIARFLLRLPEQEYIQAAEFEKRVPAIKTE